jgi:hypothetical protein
MNPPAIVASGLVAKLEAEILRLPQVRIEPVHQFADGVYCRTIRVPRGTMITGAKHKTQHFNIVSQGVIQVFNDLGGELKTIKAPCVFVSEPGTQRAGLVIEDVVWTTVHATPETNIEQLEAALVEDYHGQILINTATPCPSL